jgi:MFS family permease
VIPSLLRRNANARRFFFGQSVSLLGDQISNIALPLTAVLALHASPGQMGAVLTVALIPNLLFSLHAGVWVNRTGRRREAMLLADVLRGLVTLVIPVAYAFGELSWPLLYAVAFVLGSLSVAFYVAYGGVFQAIIDRADYVEAQALVNGTRGASFLFGLSAGGVLVQLLRGPYALVIDAFSYLWSAFFMSRVDAPDPPVAEHSEGGVLAGARWIRGNAIIRAELLGVATLNLFNFIYFALFLLYATRSLHVRPGTLGVVLGVASIGTVFGSVVTARISRRIGVGPAFLIGCFLFPAPLILVPAAGGPHWLVVVLLFTAELLSGFGLMLLDILAGAMSAAVIPPHLRSRVSGAFMVVNNGVRPLGTAIGGVLGSTIGLRPTLWIGTVGALAGMFFLLPSPIRSLHDVPDEAPS